MTSSADRKLRIVMVGPGRKAQGGIAAVINNYRSSSLWSEFDCHHFASCTEAGRLSRLAYSSWRYLAFVGRMVIGRPDLLVVHVSSGLSFYRKACYLLTARLLRIPQIMHIHPAHFREFYAAGPVWRQSLIRRFARWSLRIIFLSDLQRDSFAGVFPQEKMVVVGNPVNTRCYAVEANRAPRSRRQILYLGWIVPAKGVYDLVAAMPLVLQEFPDATLVFAGPKEVDKLRTQIVERGLDSSMRVLGWVEGAQRLHLLHSSRLLILPSYTEGVPNVILEAMASRLPVIATPVGGVPSIVTDGVSGRMVEPGDIGGIAQAMCRLLRDDLECERLAEAGYREVVEKHDTEVVAARLREVFLQALVPRMPKR
ncbi:MAG: glycosyltransferase family 4 protein [Gammaproteobacteria bacterium]|nr:glycosyltransferase family 4 protein [Gammaproteobacteria bacterium]QOJ31994.1 MAG: glycosyltransferase family 4 protein [Gammaproteobacteria bacterium]